MNDIPIETVLKTNIRKLRTELGWSQEKLAEKINVSPSHITQIENGNRSPSIETIAKISNAFGVEYSDLFFPNIESSKNKEKSQKTFSIHVLENRVLAAVKEAIKKEFEA